MDRLDRQILLPQIVAWQLNYHSILWTSSRDEGSGLHKQLAAWIETRSATIQQVTHLICMTANSSFFLARTETHGAKHALLKQQKRLHPCRQKTGAQLIAQRVTVIISPMAVCLAQTQAEAPCPSIQMFGVEGFVCACLLLQRSQELLLGTHLFAAVLYSYIHYCRFLRTVLL